METHALILALAIFCLIPAVSSDMTTNSSVSQSLLRPSFIEAASMDPEVRQYTPSRREDEIGLNAPADGVMEDGKDARSEDEMDVRENDAADEEMDEANPAGAAGPEAGSEDAAVGAGRLGMEASLAGEPESGESTTLVNYLLSSEQAKTVFTRNRRSFLGIGERSEEREQDNEEHRREESTREARLSRTCPPLCWGAWGSYGSCSVSCGSSGVRWRHRTQSVSSVCRTWIQAHGCYGSNYQSSTCNRYCQGGGTLRSSYCSCPPGRRGTCCETAVTCGSPGVLPDGQVTPGGYRHAYGTVVKFTCNRGYQLIGHSSKTCLASGQWTVTYTRCSLIDCGPPDDLVNGNVAGVHFTYDQTIRFSCNLGYHLLGDNIRQCQQDGTWSGTQPTCKEITCPTLSHPDHGQVATPGGRTHGQIAIYSCDEGSYLSGSKQRTCQLSGLWSGTSPVCLAVTCGSPGVLRYGQRTPSEDVQLYRTVVRFSCNQGYELKGDASRECLASGQWSHAVPECSLVDCGSPDDLVNGNVAGVHFTYNQTLRFSCNLGYRLLGDNIRQCQQDGTWSGTQPTCTVVTCPTPPSPSCGQVTTPGGYTYGQTATYSCDEGCYLSGSDQRTCQESGDWSDDTPVCHATTCPDLEDPSDGRILYFSCNNFPPESGCLAVFMCDPGYTLDGMSALECQSSGTQGSWSAVPPSCRAL